MKHFRTSTEFIQFKQTCRILENIVILDIPGINILTIPGFLQILTDFITFDEHLQTSTSNPKNLQMLHALAVLYEHVGDVLKDDNNLEC